jgi:hypothetical protein
MKIANDKSPDRMPAAYECWIPISEMHERGLAMFGNPEEYDIDPTEVIAPAGTIQVRFDYPLSNPFVAEFSQPQEWAAQDFILAVCNKYEEIYAEEAATTKVVPIGHQGSLANRNQTNGKYGIWGHVIEDLSLEGFNKGEDGIYELWLGS